MKLDYALELLAYISIAFGAHLVAYLSVGGVTAHYLAAYFVAFGFLSVAFKVITVARGGTKAGLGVINALSNEEAKRRAEAVLGDPKKFHCVVAPPRNTQALAPLGPTLRLFFERYEAVESMVGEMRIIRAGIGPSNLNRRFLKIGSDVGFTEIAVHPGEEEVYQIDGTEPSDYVFRPFPTIYHWILRVAEDLYSNE